MAASTAHPIVPARIPPATAVAAVAVTVVSWASAFPLIRLALSDMNPIPLASARFAIAAALVLAWLAWKRPPLPSARDGVLLAVCGFVGIAAYNVLLNTGQQTVPAGAASFIVNTVPIFTAILAFFALRERLTPWGWAGTVVSFLGVGLIASGQPGGLSFGAGASLVLAAALCSAVSFVLYKPLIDRYGALTCVAYAIVAGALFLSPWLPEAFTALERAPAATRLSVLALGVLPAAVGYATWSVALGHFGPARATNFLYLVPPTAMVLGFGLLGEVPGVETLVGGAVAIAGVIVVNTRGRRAASAPRRAGAT